MKNKKITIYQEDGLGEEEILEDCAEQIRDFFRDELTQKDAMESFDCEKEELQKFKITITVEDRTGY